MNSEGSPILLLINCDAIAEYAVMLAVISVIVVGTLRLIGTQANTVFSNVASSIQ
jgi:Flp pilus assembly pilin Flp